MLGTNVVTKIVELEVDDRLSMNVFTNVQGPPTRNVFFNLDILGTFRAATMLFLGSN